MAPKPQDFTGYLSSQRPNFASGLPAFLSEQSSIKDALGTSSGSAISASMVSATTGVNGINSAVVTDSYPYGPSRTAGVGPFQTGNANSEGGSGFENRGHRPSIFGAAAGVAVVLIIIALSAIFCFMCRRKKRARSRQQAAVAMNDGVAGQEMKKTTERPISVSSSPSYVQPPTSPPPAMTTLGSQTSSSTTTQNSVPTLSNRSDPVILSTTMDRNYYTGIDTSDHISLADNRSSRLSSDGYAESTDEPPPPYRPRSVVSRETSLRMPNGLNLLQAQQQHQQHLHSHHHMIRSPFDDPIPGYQSGGVSPVDEEDTDAQLPTAGISGISGISSHRNRSVDQMSDVSDISYQNPVVGHSTV